MTDQTEYPLENWFDTTRIIPKDAVEIVIDQMALYALKDGEDPDSPEALIEYQELKNAVRKHNLKFYNANNSNKKSTKSAGQKARRLLNRGRIIEVVFIKADGTERTMRCTRNPETISEGVIGNKTVKLKPVDGNVIRVFDIDICEWRSFDVNSVTSYRCL